MIVLPLVTLDAKQSRAIDRMRNDAMKNAFTKAVKWAYAEGDKLYAFGIQLCAEGRKLYDEGDKLCAKGGKLREKGTKLRDEGIRLCAEGRKLCAEGTKLRDEGTKLCFTIRH